MYSKELMSEFGCPAGNRAEYADDLHVRDGETDQVLWWSPLIDIWNILTNPTLTPSDIG